MREVVVERDVDNNEEEENDGDDQDDEERGKDKRAKKRSRVTRTSGQYRRVRMWELKR